MHLRKLRLERKKEAVWFWFLAKWFLPYKDLLKAVLVDKTATTQLLTVLVESSENAGARAVVVMTFLAV